MEVGQRWREKFIILDWNFCWVFQWKFFYLRRIQKKSRENTCSLKSVKIVKGRYNIFDIGLSAAAIRKSRLLSGGTSEWTILSYSGLKSRPITLTRTFISKLIRPVTSRATRMTRIGHNRYCLSWDSLRTVFRSLPIGDPCVLLI